MISEQATAGYKLLVGDCIESMRTLPDQSVNCCVTSPPYFGLRDYGHDGQIGLESSPDEFVAALVAVFREVRRVLRDDGTLWLNLGDSYAGRCSGNHGYKDGRSNRNERRGPGQIFGLKDKDLIGIPWRVAFALQQPWLECSSCGTENHATKWATFASGRRICPECEKSKGSKVSEAGWYLRQDIIWHKPNPMPESVRDRCTKSHEYIFMFSKSPKYYYDHEAVKEPAVATHASGNGFKRDARESYKNADGSARGNESQWSDVGGKRNRRSVWTVSTKPYPGAHFATFPPDLIEPCILAGCPKGGTLIDTFGGSGTTAGVAVANNRNAIICELSPDYAELIPDRVNGICGKAEAKRQSERQMELMELV